MIADPQRDTMFNNRVYNGGAMALQFLREKVGDETFFKIMRTWVNAHRNGNVTTEDFTRHVQKVTGKDFSAFWETWIYSPGKPPLP